MRRAVEYEKNPPKPSPSKRTVNDSEQLDDSLLSASVPADNAGDACELFGVTCGAPESLKEFHKEFIQDDDSYFRELARRNLKLRGSSCRDDGSIGTASLENLEATLKRYSSRVGGQSGFGSGEVLELFNEISYDDNSFVTETTAGNGDESVVR